MQENCLAFYFIRVEWFIEPEVVDFVIKFFFVDVYFEQLLGAARTQKLVELLFFSGFQAFLFILNFFQWFHGWNQNTTTITGLNIFV